MNTGTPPTPTQLWLDSTAEQRRAVKEAFGECSRAMTREGVAGLRRAGLDLTVRRGLPDPAALAEVALRHRDRVGRIPGFGPSVYAEMIGPMRAGFGELHPDDARDLAAHDLWEVEDRWTGKPVDAATRAQLSRGERAQAKLRMSALASLG